MPITPTTALNAAGGDLYSALETLINALRGNQIQSATLGDMQVTFNLVGGGSVISDMPKVGSGIVSGTTIAKTVNPREYTIQSGIVQIDGAPFGDPGGFAPITLALAAPDATNPRIDLFVCDNTFVITTVTGTPSATPAYPAIPANNCLIYAFYVPSVADGRDEFMIETRTAQPVGSTAGLQDEGFVLRTIQESSRPATIAHTGAGTHDNRYTNVIMDSSGGGFTLTLDDPTALQEGLVMEFQDSGSAGANNWVLQPAAVTINGGASVTCSTNFKGFRVTVYQGNYLAIAL